MISSMTGYAKKFISTPHFILKMELRSLNHRFLDINIFFSKELTFLEQEARKRISKLFFRGKIEGTASIKFLSTEFLSPFINKDLLNKIINSLENIRFFQGENYKIELGNLLNLPGVFNLIIDENKIKELIEPVFFENWDNLLEELRSARLQEGSIILESILSIVNKCNFDIKELKVLIDKNKKIIEENINRKVQEMKMQDKIQPQRLSEEIFYYLIKSDVTEEITRLDTHFKRIEIILNTKEQVGKELDFLLQEASREVQTILSKSLLNDISNLALELKFEIEKLRQQVQNLE